MARPRTAAKTETTVEKKKEVTESPAVSETPQDEGFLVCVALKGGVQIHLIKDESEDTIEAKRDEDKPRVAEVRSKVLKLGDYVSVAEADPTLVDAVKNDEIEQLKYATDERDVKVLAYEAKAAAAEELVYVSRVYYSAEKQVGQGQFSGPLVGAAARS